MEKNKTIVIYTKEGTRYHAFITGINLFISSYDKLEACEEEVRTELRAVSLNSTLDTTANEMKRYFSDADIETIRNIVKIDVIEY